MSEKPGGVPNPADFFGWLNQMVNFPANFAAAAPQNPAAATDPLAFWKNVGEKNEETWAKFMQQMVGTPEFAKAFGQAASSNAAYRQMVKQAAKVYLEAAGMPTTEDMARLGEQLVDLDAKVDNLGDNGEDVPKLLNRLVTLMESIAGRLERLETRVLTRENLNPLTERLAALEAKVLGQEEFNRISQRLESLENRAATRADMESISQRLAKLEGQLNEPESKDTTSAPAGAPSETRESSAPAKPKIRKPKKADKAV